MPRIRDLLVVGDIRGCPKVFEPLVRFEHRNLQLADISGRPDLSGEELHNHLFKGDGLERAVQSLCEESPSCLGIGFSAGGTALWHAVKAGLNLQALICISSTRLRFEVYPLHIPTLAIWGECDPNRPHDTWNDAVPSCSQTYAAKPHDFYSADIANPGSDLRKDIAAFIERAM